MRSYKRKIPIANAVAFPNTTEHDRGFCPDRIFFADLHMGTAG